MAPAFILLRSKAEPSSLGCLEIDGAGLAALVVLELVRKALFLLERVHAGGFYRADMDERVIAAGLVGDEAVALGRVEKFYGADWHI